ncbi:MULTISPECIES: response regulator transcription factor [unclassified Ruminococcus]|uniref:response regulator transcription factor n=1 Tax=unclassified Ruminococcus TaxID=2608920 RepID=UPI00210E6711|nr:MULTISPECIES: helix-turn-helix transcriptional regulator [unclassified Ruminococcus]MCQ4022966.1 hypothetical protein [Ruminococcus sp. zg-924]MCQ4115336.1 hypothetical protein [Ruminococcus sp. zg-921]
MESGNVEIRKYFEYNASCYGSGETCKCALANPSENGGYGFYAAPVGGFHEVSSVSTDKDDENVYIGVCVIGQGEDGRRFFRNVSTGFLGIFNGCRFSFGDILYCCAVESCVSTMTPTECRLRVDYRNGDEKVYTVLFVPFISDSGSQNVLLNVLPTYNSDYVKEPEVLKGITDREQQIVDLAASGCTNRYIAHKLMITEGTVKKTLHNAYKKLGINSRMELIRLIHG